MECKSIYCFSPGSIDSLYQAADEAVNEDVDLLSPILDGNDNDLLSSLTSGMDSFMADVLKATDNLLFNDQTVSSAAS